MIYVFSNDVNCDKDFLFMRYFYNRKIQRVFYQTRSLVSSSSEKPVIFFRRMSIRRRLIIILKLI